MNIESDPVDQNRIENTFESHEPNPIQNNITQETETPLLSHVDANAGEDRSFVSAESYFNENNKNVSYIFSASFGVVDLLDIDNDPRYLLASKTKGFKKKTVLPTPKFLKDEIVRRAKNASLSVIPRPTSWKIKKMQRLAM